MLEPVEFVNKHILDFFEEICDTASIPECKLVIYCSCTLRAPGTGSGTRSGNDGFLYYTMYLNTTQGQG